VLARKITRWKGCVALAFAAVVTTALMSTTVLAATIGTITSTGRFHMNGAEVWNQAALMEGTSLQTGQTATRLLLRNGTDMRIGATSSGKVFANRMVLENGSLEGLLARSFRLETAQLGLQVEGENARAHVRVSDGQILVASLQGAVRVRGSQGLLLANLSEGNAVALSAQPEGTTVGTRLTGVIQHKNYRYYLTDETTNVTVELRGELPSKNVGKRVTIQGDVDSAAVPSENADYAVRVTQVTNPAEAAASGAGAGGGTGGGAAAGAAGGTGMATGAKVAIIGGVAAAGAATTGLVVAGGSDDKPQVSP
jgi:hypothetical protein